MIPVTNVIPEGVSDLKGTMRAAGTDYATDACGVFPPNS
jgi:hypothetical protein